MFIEGEAYNIGRKWIAARYLPLLLLLANCAPPFSHPEIATPKPPFYTPKPPISSNLGDDLRDGVRDNLKDNNFAGTPTSTPQSLISENLFSVPPSSTSLTDTAYSLLDQFSLLFQMCEGEMEKLVFELTDIRTQIGPSYILYTAGRTMEERISINKNPPPPEWWDMIFSPEELEEIRKRYGNEKIFFDKVIQPYILGHELIHACSPTKKEITREKVEEFFNLVFENFPPDGKIYEQGFNIVIATPDGKRATFKGLEELLTRSLNFVLFAQENADTLDPFIRNAYYKMTVKSYPDEISRRLFAQLTKLLLQNPSLVKTIMNLKNNSDIKGLIELLSRELANTDAIELVDEQGQVVDLPQAQREEVIKNFLIMIMVETFSSSDNLNLYSDREGRKPLTFHNKKTSLVNGKARAVSPLSSRTKTGQAIFGHFERNINRRFSPNHYHPKKRYFGGKP